MKNELKHVEDTQTAVSRRFSQLSVGSRQTTEMSSSSSSSHEEDQVAMRRSNSKDLILDLVPAPVETMEVKSTESKSVSQVDLIHAEHRIISSNQHCFVVHGNRHIHF